MFSSISNAVAHVWGSSGPKGSSGQSSAAEIHSEDTKTPLSYPCVAGSYDGDIQPQYGQEIPSKNVQANSPKSVQFQLGDGTDECEAEQSGTTRTINGKITHVYSNYGLIDNSIHFKFDAILYNMKPTVGLLVEALVDSGGHKDVGLRATEVVISKADWDNAEGGNEETEWHIGKVTKTERTTGWIDDTTFYDQDACPYGFSPHRGDWLIAEMTRNIETGAKVVRTLRPLREKHFKGFVTHVYPGYGFIDGTIFFSRKACDQNYTPQRDDQVEGNAIESDQSKGKWRAVAVSLKKQQRTIHAKQFPAHSFQEGEQMKNKNDIAVTVSGEFSRMFIGQEKRVTVYVRNTGEEPRTLLKTEAVCLLSDIKVSADGAAEDKEKTAGLSSFKQSIEIKSGCKISLAVAVTARTIGKSVCQIIMTFGTFSISRPIPITVQENANTPKTSGRLSGKEKWMKEHAMISSGKGPVVLPGVRPARTSNPNIPVKLGMYPVSKRLKEWYAEKKDITEIIPALKEALSMENYFAYFSALLHIEELKMEVDMREFDIERASMRPRGEFLSLEVPGLAEGRPSVLNGDKIILTEPYANPNSPRYEGFVHEVHGEDVFLKFHPQFQERYGAELFSVMFTFSRTSLRRCHQATEVATVNLGKEVLFPSDLKAKSPQVEISFATIHRSVVYPGRVKTIIKLPPPKNIQGHFPSAPSVPKESSKSQGTLESTINITPGPTGSTASQDIRLARKSSAGGQSSDGGMDKDSVEPKFLVPNALLDGVASTLAMAERGEGEDKAEFFNNKLNARQRSAVMRILKGEGRPTPYILFGPPGTGKTITVVETILQIHRHLASSRILACTPSNSAADLLAERLHQSGAVKKIDMVRLNSFRRSEENIPESIHQYCSNGEELRAVGHHRIIISTCSTGGQFYSLGLKPGHFTHVIIDEAGQATEPEALVGMGLAAGPDGQVVLAGDPMQLGPVITSCQAAELGLERSLLERLMKRDMYQRDGNTFRDHGGYNPLLVTKLVDNYRSHPALLKLPSQCFYHDELNACANIAMREMACDWNQLPNKRGFPIIFHGIQGADLKEGNSPSWCNPAEAVQAVTYLQELLSCSELNLRETDIGIITPYRKQVEKLNLLLDCVDILDTKVGSVEEFQGQERPVIIISTVRSSSSLMAFDTRHQLGFLSNPKRFNVAITRPQALLIVVGNPHLLVNDYFWRAMLRYCLKNNAYVGCEPPSEQTMKRLDGPLEEEKEEEVEEECSHQDTAGKVNPIQPEQIMKRLDGKQEEDCSHQNAAGKVNPIQPETECAVVEAPMQIAEGSKTFEQAQADSNAEESGEVKQTKTASPVAQIPSESKQSLTDQESFISRADDTKRLVDGSHDNDILSQSAKQERTDDINSSNVISDLPNYSSAPSEIEHMKRGRGEVEVVVGKEEKESTEVWDVYDSEASEATSSIPWCTLEEDSPKVDGSTSPSRGWYDATGEPFPDLRVNSEISSSESDKRLQEIYPSHTAHPENRTIPDHVELPCMPLTGSGHSPGRTRYEKDTGRDDWRRNEGGGFARRGGRKDYGPSHKEPPRERKKLILQKRTQPMEQNPVKAASASSIFGGAKPVDTTVKERGIAERLEKEKRQFEQQKQTQTQCIDSQVPSKEGLRYTGARVRQDSDRSQGREGSNRHSSSGSEREWTRPPTMRRESERSNEREVFYKDDQTPVSPNPKSDSTRQQNDVRIRNSHRSQTYRKDNYRPSQSNVGCNAATDRQVIETATRKSSSSRKSPRSYENSNKHVPQSKSERPIQVKLSRQDSGQHCVRDHMRMSPSVNSVSEDKTMNSVDGESDEDTGEDFSASSWASGHHNRTFAHVQPSENNFPDNHARNASTGKSQGPPVSSATFTASSRNSIGRGDFVKHVSRGRGLSSNAFAFTEPKVGKGTRSPQVVAQQAKVNPPITSHPGLQNAPMDQNNAYTPVGFGRGLYKPRQMAQDHSPGYQEGQRGDGRGFNRGRGVGRGRGRGRGLLATNFNFGQ